MKVTTPKERRLRRQVEILWILFTFMLVMNFFSICLWPLVKGVEAESAEAAEKAASSHSVAEPEQPKETLTFVLDRNGGIRIGNRLATEKMLREIFSSTPTPGVELILPDRMLAALFDQCARQGIAPTVKLAETQTR